MKNVRKNIFSVFSEKMTLDSIHKYLIV